MSVSNEASTSRFANEKNPRNRRQITMQAIRFSLLVVILAGVMAITGSYSNLVPQVKAHEGCSLKTLRGNYGGVWTGLIYPGPTPANPQLISTFLPYDGMEVSTWDGAGNFSASDVFAVGGTPAQPANDYGTYTVNANCTGTLILTNGLTFDFIVIHGGDEIKFAETDGYPTVVTETRMGAEREP
jgi:hypothetical protein